MKTPEKPRVLRARVTERLHDAVVRAAEREGRTVSGWVRHVLELAIERLRREDRP